MNPILRSALLIIVVAVLAACSGGASSTQPPASAPPASEAPVDSAPPGAGGGEPGNPGAPGVPDSERVDPQPGQQNVVSIPLERIEATVDGRVVTITAHWSSGVAPCSVLDQVVVNSGNGTLDLTIREGTSDPDAICVLMLQAKHTVIDLELEPGTWTIRDTEGGAQPVEVTVG